jgi:hypothetical protein
MLALRSKTDDTTAIGWSPKAFFGRLRERCEGPEEADGGTGDLT